MKFVPVAVSVNAALFAMTLAGETEASVGNGFGGLLIVKTKFCVAFEFTPLAIR